MMMDDGPEVMEDYGGGGSPEEQPGEGYTSIEEEKADILNKLSRLEKKGFNVNKRLTAYSSITELRTELKRIMYGIETEQSIKFSRRMLIACVTGVEFLKAFQTHCSSYGKPIYTPLICCVVACEGVVSCPLFGGVTAVFVFAEHPLSGFLGCSHGAFPLAVL